ncbi:MAG: type II secretion system F family protein, partial [Phycisphaerae bacterium]|nr:type II secretion system F family protein [Phycisphaerae bacterium]
MSTFSYKAITRSGQSVQGRIDAENPQQASETLARKGLFVDDIDLMPGQPQIDLSSSGKKTYKIKLSNRDRTEFVRQLATALQARMPLMTALQIVRQQNPRPVVKQLIGQLSDIVKSGQSLSYALSLYPRTFDKLHISMVAVGESTGSLDQSTTQLADLTES